MVGILTYVLERRYTLCVLYLNHFEFATTDTVSNRYNKKNNEKENTFSSFGWKFVFVLTCVRGVLLTFIEFSFLEHQLQHFYGMYSLPYKYISCFTVTYRQFLFFFLSYIHADRRYLCMCTHLKALGRLAWEMGLKHNNVRMCLLLQHIEHNECLQQNFTR